MGPLKEWFLLYRRAQSDPVPVPSAQPVKVAPLPPAEAAPPAASPLLPSRDTLLYGSLPLMLGTTAAILVALGVTAAVRRIRLASRAPSR
jgi:hypothetical protein